MDTVRKDCGGEVKGCFLEVTERWLSGEDDTGDLPRTWETVFDALKQTGFPLLVREVKEQLSEEQSFTEAEVDTYVYTVEPRISGPRSYGHLTQPGSVSCMYFYYQC